ncbi:uncharacterized protein [Apostichopus japonicus]
MTAIFQDGDIKLALAGETAVNIYKYSSADSQFYQIQTIEAGYAFIVEKLIIEGQTYMIIGFSGSDNTTSGADSSLAVYKWEGAHFDNSFECSVPYLTDICPFEVHGHYFLAVSVCEPHNDIYPDQSYIMRYNLHTEAFLIDQYIYTHGAKDWEFFVISEDKDQENFLVLASNEKDESGVERSIIYKYIWHKFVPFQCLETSGAKKWQAITVGTDILIALSDSSGLVFYQYDGWRFSQITYSRPQPMLNQPLQSFAAVTVNTTEYIVIAPVGMLPSTSNYTVFQLEFQLANEVGSFQETLETICNENREKLESVIARIANITKEFPNLVYINSNETQVLTGNITFAENVGTADADVRGNASSNHGHIFNATEAQQFERMKDQADRQMDDINWLRERLNNTMKTIGVQTVTAEKSFKDLSSPSSIDGSVVAVTSDFMNKYINLTDVNTNIFRKDKNTTVEVSLAIDGSVILEGDLDVKGDIDEISTDNIVTLAGNHTIAEPKTFSQYANFSGDLFVAGLIDGVNMTDDTVLLTSSNQAVGGTITFSKPVTFGENLAVDGNVDSVDISDLEAISVYKNATHFIEGIKTFKTNLTSLDGLSLSSGKTIDSVSVEEMDQNILKVTGGQNITGSYTFTNDLDMQGNLSVEGTVNGLNLPGDILLVDSSELFVIGGPISFTQNLNVSNMTARVSIDGISTNTGGAVLDLLSVSPMDNSDQVVTGSITFRDDLVLEKDTACDGDVDGVDLSELAQDAVGKDEDARVTGFKTFMGSLHFQQDIMLEGLISGVNLTSLDAGVLKLDDTIWSPNAKLIFSAPNAVFAANLETYNQHSFDSISFRDLSLHGQNETINGVKTFQAIHSNSKVDVMENVNGVSVTRLCLNAVYLNDNYGIKDIVGDITFEKNLRIEGSLILNGTLEGLYLQDLVTLHGRQDIYSSTGFYSKVYVEELMAASDVNVTQEVNRENVVEIYYDTLLSVADQNITGHKTFMQAVVIDDNLQVNGSVNDVDISDLADDAVYDTGNHTILEEKVFTSTFWVDKMKIGGFVNGANFSEFVDDIVLQNEPQTITGNLSFLKTLNLNSSLDVEGTINGLSLTEFNSSVHKVTDEEFTGELQFGMVYANDTISVDSLVNGVDIGDDTLVKDQEGQSVSGIKTFTSEVRVNGNITCDTVNDVDINYLDASILKTEGNQNITGNYIFWYGVTWLSNATVGGLIDGVDISSLADSIWKTENPDKFVLNVTGNGTFNILQSGDVFYNGTLDGVDLQELNQTYVSLTRSQTITESKHFLDKVLIDESSNLKSDYLNVEGTVKGLNLSDIASRAFISGNAGQEIDGTLTFTENVTFLGDVTLDGTVDEISISNGVMLTHRPNFVKAHKNLSNELLEITSSLFMKDRKKVQGVDVSEMKLRSADRINNYLIQEDTTFINMTMLSGLILEGLLNGVNFSTEYILTIPHDQTVFGNYTFLTDTVFNGEMTSTLINGLDMVDLATNTLFTSGDQTITGNITLASVDTFLNITTFGLLGGVKVPQLYQSLFYYPDLENLNNSLTQQCEVLDEIHYLQQNDALLFRGLVEIDVISTVGNVLWFPSEVNGEQWVILGISPVYDAFRNEVNPDQCATVSVRRWDDEQYQEELLMTFDVVEDVKYFNTGVVKGFAVAETIIDGACLNISGISNNITELPDVTLQWEPSSSANWVHVIYQNEKNDTYHQRLFALGPATIEVFEADLRDHLCVFVGNKFDEQTFGSVMLSYLYCHSYLDDQDDFIIQDTIETYGVVKAKYFAANGTSFLVIGNRVDSVSGTYKADSYTVIVNDLLNIVSLDRFPTTAVSYVTAGEVKGQQLFLFANEFSGSWMFEDFTQSVDIYRFSPKGIELYQKIETYGAKAAVFFSVAKMDFLAILDRNEKLILYKYSGVLLFVEHYSLYIPGATDVAAQKISEAVVNIFVATLSGNIKLFPWEPMIPVPSPTQIFQVVLSGFILPGPSCSSNPI